MIGPRSYWFALVYGVGFCLISLLLASFFDGFFIRAIIFFSVYLSGYLIAELLGWTQPNSNQEAKPE